MMIADNVARVRGRINNAAIRAGRAADSVTLVAVSKQKPLTAIVAAYQAGVRHFGENRAHELQDKASDTAIDLPELNWHFIGHLQTRQSMPVAQHAAVFHAVDRLKIAERLSRQLVACEREQSMFIEVNLSGEQTKGGFDCAAWESDGGQRDALCAAVSQLNALPNVKLSGLMAMAPWGADEAVIRPLFARTRRLAEWLREMDAADLPHLSIGMTDDYEIAIEEGATHVRVGRGIFGGQYN